jgi:hypothetical protein
MDSETRAVLRANKAALCIEKLSAQGVASLADLVAFCEQRGACEALQRMNVKPDVAADLVRRVLAGSLKPAASPAAVRVAPAPSAAAAEDGGSGDSTGAAAAAKASPLVRTTASSRLKSAAVAAVAAERLSLGGALPAAAPGGKGQARGPPASRGGRSPVAGRTPVRKADS